MVASIDRIAKTIEDWAKSEPLVSRVYLYGSRVKGTENERSDIDVAVKLNRIRGDTLDGAGQAWDIPELSERLQRLLPYPLQLEWYDPVQTPKVHKGIMEASVLVYDEHDAEND